MTKTLKEMVDKEFARYEGDEAFDIAKQGAQFVLEKLAPWLRHRKTCKLEFPFQANGGCTCGLDELMGEKLK